MTIRNELRQHFRDVRRSLTSHQHQANSELLTAQLRAILKSPKRVAGYLSNDGELGLSHFIEQNLKKTRFALPVLHPFVRNTLLFQAWTPDDEMTQNRFGIDEPIWSCPKVIPITEFDYILLPLVAFDRQRNRLGMGGGFYDRTLANIRQKAGAPLLIGIAHDEQEYEGILPTESWDIPLDYIVTPTRVI